MSEELEINDQVLNQETDSADEPLSDEELARRTGLLRDGHAHFGYIQPFYITRDGIVDSINGCLISRHQSDR